MSSLTDDQIEALLSALAVLKFKESETIITQGETSPEFYIIKEGLVNIYNKNKNIIYMKKGDYFGEQCLIYNTSRIASAKAITNTTLLSFSHESLSRALGQRLELTLYFNTIRIAISKDPILSQLTESQVTRILPKIHVIEIDGPCLRYSNEEL